MSILFELFYKNGQNFEIGDIFYYKYNNAFYTVKTLTITYLNGNYNKSLSAKLPFSYSPNIELTEDIINIIKNQYDASSDTIKEDYKKEMDFILTFKVINYPLYNLFKKIKDIEFIPKTYLHLKVLKDAGLY
jgi:hypothetical protein